MIHIYKDTETELFYKGMDRETKDEVRGTRYYVVEGDNGLFLSFISKDEKTVKLFAGEDNCALMTDDEKVIEKAKGISAENGIKELFRFFVNLTAKDFDRLKNFEEKIEDLEDEIFDNRANACNLKKIQELNRQVLHMKRYYEQMELLSDDLSDLDSRFDFIDRKFDRLLNSVLRTQDFLDHTREAYQSQIDIEQNDIMKVLTIAATIFMPLTLITGWYGMNLRMPEYGHQYGYPTIILISSIILIVEIFYFKKKKWM